MTEIQLAELETRPDREPIDQTPARLWAANGTRVLVERHYVGAFVRALLAKDLGHASDWVAEREREGA